MRNNEEQEESKATIGFRASVDLAMGVLYIVISSYFMIFPYLIESFWKYDVKILGGLLIFYGLFRIVRGLIKFKNTFMKKSRI